MYGSSRKLKVNTLMAVAAAVALAGCGQDQISNPTPDTFAGRPIPLPASERQGLAAQELPSVTVVVSANGGTVQMGRYTLTFPAGALTGDTPITMTQTDPNAMVLELLPHGIQFKKPVTLSAHVSDVADPDANTVGVAWFNPTTSTWQIISQNPGTSESATGQLWHFSDYGIFEQ